MILCVKRQICLETDVLAHQDDFNLFRRFAAPGDHDVVADGIGAITITAYTGKNAGCFSPKPLHINGSRSSVGTVNGAVQVSGHFIQPCDDDDLLGTGNHGGATVAVAVAIEEAATAGNF